MAMDDFKRARMQWAGEQPEVYSENIWGQMNKMPAHLQKRSAFDEHMAQQAAQQQRQQMPQQAAPQQSFTPPQRNVQSPFGQGDMLAMLQQRMANQGMMGSPLPMLQQMQQQAMPQMGMNPMLQQLMSGGLMGGQEQRRQGGIDPMMLQQMLSGGMLG